MKTGLLVSLLCLLVFATVMIVADIILALHGGYKATISWETWQASKTHPVIPLLCGFIVGLLFGHLFWSQ